LRVDPRDATTFRRIPVTTVPRTLVDLAAVLAADELTRADAHEHPKQMLTELRALLPSTS
jgi:hypothetical protein